MLQVIHGAHETVDFICDHSAIKAVSFVGSDTAGKYIYERAGRNGKRVQCNMGAKNHGVIMADANKEHTLNQLTGAAFGAAGQRYVPCILCYSFHMYLVSCTFLVNDDIFVFFYCIYFHHSKNS